MFSIPQPRDLDSLNRLSTASQGCPEHYLAVARGVLQAMLARSGLLDGLVLERKPGGYARTLLFGDERMSLWAMVWDAGARTIVHDHHCSCCFAVLEGTLRERRFRALDETRAVMTGETLLSRGHIDCLLPSGPNLHQVVNDTDREAISLHIYGFDHRRHASSVHREYQIAAQ